MVSKAAKAPLLSWAMDLDDSGIVLIRLTLDIRDGGDLPDVAALNVALEAMVRGWRPAVEEALAEIDSASATRLASKCPGVMNQAALGLTHRVEHFGLEPVDERLLLLELFSLENQVHS